MSKRKPYVINAASIELAKQIIASMPLAATINGGKSKERTDALLIAGHAIRQMGTRDWDFQEHYTSRIDSAFEDAGGDIIYPDEDLCSENYVIANTETEVAS